MWRKILPFLFLTMTVGLLLSACGQQQKEEPFPPESAFSARVEIVSVTQDDEGNYIVEAKAILKNESETTYRLFGNPSCWNMLFVNGQGHPVDLPGGYRDLESGAEIAEEKTVTLSNEEFLGAQLHVESEFTIERGNGEKQRYTIISEAYSLSEADLPA